MKAGALHYILALFLIAPLCAAEPDASLLERKGDVLYTPADRAPLAVSTNQMPLYARDKIETLTNATATVGFTNTNPIRLREKTTLVVRTPERTGGIALELLRGALYYFSRERPRDVQIRTRNGVGAPFGTEFLIEATESGTFMALFDGKATFTNELGKVDLTSGDYALAENGKAPVKARLSATNIVQWWIYYPAVLDTRDLAINENDKPKYEAAIAAYNSGDLRKALTLFPGYPDPAAPADENARILLSALYLGAGQPEKARSLLSSTAPAANALRLLMRAAQRDVAAEPPPATTASEHLGLSYYFQARHDLAGARAAAERATIINTNFGAAWARLAELQFSFGDNASANASLKRALALSPANAQAHALKGFIAAGENRWTDALASFDEAIRLDSTLGNGWLGRGLVRMRSNQKEEGLADLRMAAIQEPERSVLRSYLGKALAEQGRFDVAEKEFARAKFFDEKDPTPWLYEALLKRDANQINAAVTNLETSISLNTNRAVFRSAFLLDQDRAVRSANLAAIYRDAGLTEVSAREAAQAVAADYGNYSAHLFLANSYNALRDPSLVNLRYETATFSEYLLANLLSPVGGTDLSPTVSQQEYSRLFERNRFGLVSQTSYLSYGDWTQSAAQFGRWDDIAYSLDMYYRTSNGQRANNDLRQQAYSAQGKYQLTPNDSIYLQGIVTRYDSGDLRQLYSPTQADPNLRLRERQEPNALLGYHHQWSPASHTLFLAARLDDRFDLSTANFPVPGVTIDGNGQIVDTVANALPGANEAFDSVSYKSDFEAYSLEAQQILQLASHQLIAGARAQFGETISNARLQMSGGNFPPYTSGFGDFISTQSATTDLERYSAYFYDQWRALDQLTLSAGLSYDRLTYPQNSGAAPLDSTEESKDQISPKAGFLWSINNNSRLRGAYSRSLSGLFYDTSVRLEPTQISGFTHAYRSIAPESVVGAIAGSEIQTFNLGYDHTFPTRTYLIVDLELLESTANRSRGSYAFDTNFFNDAIEFQLREKVAFEEQSASLVLNQLIARDWSIGARYRISQADLTIRNLQAPAAIPTTRLRALLHTASLFAILNDPTGFFADAEAAFTAQDNLADQSTLPSEDFWTFNASVGYRFPRRRAEIRLGILNIADQDYRLNPLNLRQETPHSRTFFASLKINL